MEKNMLTLNKVWNLNYKVETTVEREDWKQSRNLEFPIETLFGSHNISTAMLVTDWLTTDWLTDWLERFYDSLFVDNENCIDCKGMIKILVKMRLGISKTMLCDIKIVYKSLKAIYKHW